MIAGLKTRSGNFLLIAVAAVYVNLGAPGNAKAQDSCAASAVIAGTIAPLVGGELAGLVVHKQPLPLPETALSDKDDVNVKLDQWRGRTILVNLWATWCVPCRKEMPALDELQAELGGEKFEVIAINMDRGGPAKGKAFYEEIGLKSLGYFYDTTGRLIYALKSFGLPTTLLVGPDGCEIARLSGPAEWNSADAHAVIKAATGR